MADAVGEPPLPRVEGEPYATMWELGMHPAHVDEIRRRVCARDSLPAEFYLEVMGARREVVWLGQALWRLRPSDEDAVWMARHGREPEKDDDGPEAA